MRLEVLCLLTLAGSSRALHGGGLQQSDALRLDLGNSGRNFMCNPGSADTAENLKDYALLFEAGAGKSIVLAGDTLMLQAYHALRCAAEILGYHATQEGDYIVTLVVKRSADAPSQTAFRVANHLFYTIEDLTGPGAVSQKFIELFPKTHDLLAFNIAQYAYTDPVVFFSSIAKPLFEGMKKAANDTASNVALLDHTPQHFNTDTGNYWDKTAGLDMEQVGPNDCSCTQPHLQQQHTNVNNGLAGALAMQYGFHYVPLWDDMNLCKEHPFDCTHFTLSPTLFKPYIKNLASILAR